MIRYIVIKLILVITLLIFIAMALFFILHWIYDTTDVSLISTLVSPDKLWRTELEQTIYESGFVTVVTDELYLVAVRKPLRRIKILGLDTEGDDDLVPRYRWTAPNMLSVTVYNPSEIVIGQLEYAGVMVDVRVDLMVQVQRRARDVAYREQTLRWELEAHPHSR